MPDAPSNERLDERVGEHDKRLASLICRINELEDRVAELEEITNPDPGATDYDSLTKEQKVHRIRKTLAQKADETDGTSAMKYKEVMMLFDGHPSPGHCYDLMERAGTIDGYNYDEAGQGKGQKRICCNLGAVNDEALIHAANKATSTGPA